MVLEFFNWINWALKVLFSLLFGPIIALYHTPNAPRTYKCSFFSSVLIPWTKKGTTIVLSTHIHGARIFWMKKFSNYCQHEFRGFKTKYQVKSAWSMYKKYWNFLYSQVPLQAWLENSLGSPLWPILMLVGSFMCVPHTLKMLFFLLFWPIITL